MSNKNLLLVVRNKIPKLKKNLLQNQLATLKKISGFNTKAGNEKLNERSNK
jgi:hypothetical protein